EQARAALDREVLPQLANVHHIALSGHTDELGSDDYNQRLSEQRANAVRDYLVAKGVDVSRIEVVGLGRTVPVKSCLGQKGAALIDCLAPNRRVELAVTAQ
ncbi:MAG TPA: OmpA family protein, partial [Burkholderiales bacterium]